MKFVFKRIIAAVLMLTLLAGRANISWAIESESAIPEKQPIQAAQHQTDAAEQDPVVPIIGVLTGTETEVRKDDAFFTDVARVTVPLVEMTEDTAKEYPNLAQSLKAYIGEIREQRSTKTAELEAVFWQGSKNTGDVLKFYDEMTPYILRADSRVFSILMKDVYDYGKNRTDRYSPKYDIRFQSVNFDAVTGKILKLEDVITDKEAFLEILEKKADSALRSTADRYRSVIAGIEAESETNKIVWNLSSRGIQFIINPVNKQTCDDYHEPILIPWEEAPQLFIEKYSAVPEYWIEPKIKTIDLSVDVFGNGENEEIHLEASPDAWESRIGLGDSYSSDRFCRLNHPANGAECYLARMNDRYYAYVFHEFSHHRYAYSVVGLKHLNLIKDTSENGLISAVSYKWKATENGYTVSCLKNELTDPRCLLTVDELKTELQEAGAESNNRELSAYSSEKADLLRDVRIESIQQSRVCSSENQSTVHTYVSQVQLGDEPARKYPSLAESLTEYSTGLQGLMTEKLNHLEEICQGIKIAAQEEDCPDFYDAMSSYILRADSRILSILTCNSVYYRDEFRSRNEISNRYQCANFDTETGKRLKLSDVITDCNFLAEAVREKVITSGQEPDWDYLRSLTEAFNGNEEKNGVVWNLGYEGLQLIFQPLEKETEDMYIVSIVWKEAPRLFIQKYTVLPDVWAVPIIDGIPLSIDTMGNGKPERLYYTSESSGYEYLLNCGSRAICLYSIDQPYGYLIRTNDRYYLFTVLETDNEMSVLVINDPETLRETDSNWLDNRFSSFQHITRYQFTDPTSFRLTERIGIFSTLVTSRYYHLDQNGTLVPEDSDFEILSGFVLKLKQPLNVDTVDAKGNIIGTAILSAGDFIITGLRTDCATYIDVLKADPSVTETGLIDDIPQYITDEEVSQPIYRIYITYREASTDNMIDEWIGNGIPESALFGGRIYYP